MANRDEIYGEIAKEIRVRIQTWKAEKKALQAAAARIDELNDMIDEAQIELDALKLRKPELTQDPVGP